LTLLIDPPIFNAVIKTQAKNLKKNSDFGKSENQKVSLFPFMP